MVSFLLKKKRLLFILGLLFVGFTLLAHNIQRKPEYNFFEQLFLSAFALPLRITTSCINQTVYVWDRYFYLVNLKETNVLLNARADRLKIENQLLREQVSENQRLRRLLSFKQRQPCRIVPAEIIGRDPSSWFKTILIDKGSRHGVFSGAGVITPRGIVGTVIEVSPAVAKILLITDPNSAVDVQVKRTRTSGILEGCGENRCSLSYVIKTEDLHPGDPIVASGLNGIYPKGLPAGAITSFSHEPAGFFQYVAVQPAVDFSKLNEVLIVLKEEPDSATDGEH